VVKDSRLLGCNTQSLGNPFPTTGRNVLPSSSGVQRSEKALEVEGTTFPRNVGNNYLVISQKTRAFVLELVAKQNKNST